MARTKRMTAALGAACALALGVTSTASANTLTWQGYTRDSSWQCGPPGSTQNVGGLYLLPCVKISGEDWQAVLIATTTGQGRYINSHQTEWLGGKDGDAVNPGDCGPTGLAGHWIPPNTSEACFSPTVHSPNAGVQAEFRVLVFPPTGSNGTPGDLWSPFGVTAP